jgi:hypothetical protein
VHIKTTPRLRHYVKGWVAETFKYTGILKQVHGNSPSIRKWNLSLSLVVSQAMLRKLRRRGVF